MGTERDFVVKKGLKVTEGITLGGHTFDDIDIGTEFVDTDDHLMSSGAIKEKIESYSYGTGDATLAGTQTFSGAKTFSSAIELNDDLHINDSHGRIEFKRNASNTATNAAITFNDNADALKARILYQYSTNQMQFYVNSENQLLLNDGVLSPATDNNVDLGTSSLKFKDSFFGLVDAENFKINGGQGSDGQVLTSTGSGVAWEDAAGIVEDASPQLGGDLDTNGHDIIIDDGKGIYATAISNGLELMLFQHTANATSYLQVWNGISDSATGTLFGNDVISTDTVGTGRMTGPGLEATGSTTDVGMSFKTKGLGHFVFTNDDATSAAGPVINLLRNNLEGEVADDDIIGLIKFMGADDVMAEEGSLQSLHDYRDYAKIECNIVDQTNTTADGNLILSAMCADSHTDFLEIGTNKTNDTSAGVRAYTGSMVTYSGTGTTALSRDTHAGAYVRATGAGTFTLWDNPKVGDQVVVISDHAGTTTIDGYSSDTINGSANTTITTQYNAKTFIATSTTTWVALG